MTKPFDPTRPYQRRDGKPAKIICDDLAGSNYTIVYRTPTECGTVETIIRCRSDGLVSGYPSPHDLVNIPETIEIERWVNAYRREDGSIQLGVSMFASEALAEVVGKPTVDYVGTVRIHGTLTL